MGRGLFFKEYDFICNKDYFNCDYDEITHNRVRVIRIKNKFYFVTYGIELLVGPDKLFIYDYIEEFPRVHVNFLLMTLLIYMKFPMIIKRN